MQNNLLKNGRIAENKLVPPAGDMLRYLAFDNCYQANIISNVSSDCIIVANSAACKLLGYSRKKLLTKHRATIFVIDESSFKKMMKQRTTFGHSTALVTAIKKDGKLFPCEITSAVFNDEDGIQKSITTLTDISQHIRRQKNIDSKKKKIVAGNIRLAKSMQKIIDTKRAKTVVRNINQALAKSDARLEDQMKSKDMQIANATADAIGTARSDIGKELHDNVNQLLGASNLYIALAKKGGKDSELFLSRSSEYTLTAIEAIRKLTKKLTTGIIMDLGICTAIENISRDMMEVNPVKIILRLKSFKEKTVNEKLQLALFRILQEQLNNILKHARASRVVITLSQTTKLITLSLADNGVGFDSRKKSKGIGIENIKSRAIAFGGEAEIISQPGKGCTLKATFPVRPAPEQL
jgi:PAS domain S-box-containing protein